MPTGRNGYEMLHNLPQTIDLRPGCLMMNNDITYNCNNHMFGNGNTSVIETLKVRAYKWMTNIHDKVEERNETNT